MLKRFLAACAAVALVLVMGVRAETQPQHQGSEAAAQNSANENKVHIQGCVFPQRALSTTDPVRVVPGSTEDYVVTNTKVISISPGVKDPTGRVFKLDDVAQERLRDLNGKSVGVTARVDEKPSVPELRVIAIWETVGTCPVRPTPQS